MRRNAPKPSRCIFRKCQRDDASDAPYFVDLVREQLLQKLGDRDFNREGLHIYTSLDPDLQRVATAAVDNTTAMIGHAQVDKLYAKHHKGKEAENAEKAITYPQIALVALNPHTGQVLALVGGRSYGNSQLNHAVSARPTGLPSSSHSSTLQHLMRLSGARLPFGYAMKISFSPITILSDEQTTYDVGDQEYTLRNYEGEYHEEVTARYVPDAFTQQRDHWPCLRQSASTSGRCAGTVLAGVKSAAERRRWPSGLEDATPLDMAGAYTIFANGGLHLDPWMLASVRSPSGDVITDYSPVSKQILDPRVAYLTTSMLQNVLQGHGTGAGARTHGLPRSSRRKNRHQPRRLVRRLYQQFAVHRLGRQRRLHRHQD